MEEMLQTYHETTLLLSVLYITRGSYKLHVMGHNDGQSTVRPQYCGKAWARSILPHMLLVIDRSAISVMS